MGTTWVEQQVNGKAQKHSTFYSLSTTGSRFCIVFMINLFWKSKVQKIMGRSRRTIHIDRKTESFWQKDDPLCLVGPEGYYKLSKSVETINTKRYQEHLTNLNRSLFWKRVRKRSNQKRQHKVMFFMIMLLHIRQNRFGLRWKHSTGKFYPAQLNHQTWLLPITTCSHWWLHALAEKCIGSYEDVKKWLDEWFAARGEYFTGVVLTNYPKNLKNW